MESGELTASDLLPPQARLRERRSVPMPQYEGVQGGRYYCIQTLEQFAAFLECARRQPLLAVDTETSGLNWVHSHVCGIVIGWGVAENYYIPIAHQTGENQLNIDDIREPLQELLGSAFSTKILANAKFDLHGLRKLGIEVGGIIHDIVIEAHLLDENADHGVKELAAGSAKNSVAYVSPDADKWDKAVGVWRTEEAKRRRHEFQQKAKARLADLMADALVLEELAASQGKALGAIDKKDLKKLALERAKFDLRHMVCAKNTKEEVTYDYIPLSLMTPYACADVHYTWLIHKQLILNISQHEALKRVYINELQLLRDLHDAEHGGVKIDIPYLQKIAPEFEDEVQNFEKKVYEAVGYQFNIGSTEQLTEALRSAGVQLTKLTKKSKEAMRKGETTTPTFAVDKEVLEFLAAKYPFAEMVLKYRGLEKLKSTYIDNIQQLVDANHFLHCSYNQNVSTGRMSSAEPNLQNIPARNKAIRKAFIVPDDEHIFVFIDYSQIELRLTADRSQDLTLLGCYPFEGKGQDVHTLTLADVVLNMPLAAVQAMKTDKSGHIDKPQRGESCSCQSCMYDFYRNIAKRVNFGIIYGAGPEAIQRQVSTPTRFVDKEQCEEYIHRYFQKYPGVQEWIRLTQAFMKRHGYVQNSFGRYRRLPVQGLQKWQVERACRQGVNFLIQGEAADLFKTAAVRVNKLLRRHGARTRLVNFVHDELQFYWHKSELSLLKEVKTVMEDFQYRIPIVAEVSWSPTDWGNKKELK